MGGGDPQGSVLLITNFFIIINEPTSAPQKPNHSFAHYSSPSFS